MTSYLSGAEVVHRVLQARHNLGERWTFGKPEDLGELTVHMHWGQWEEIVLTAKQRRGGPLKLSTLDGSVTMELEDGKDAGTMRIWGMRVVQHSEDNWFPRTKIVVRLEIPA